MELNLPDGVIATARLVTIHPQFGETLGTEMPVLSAENLIPAGTTAHVQGWEREVGQVLTDFGTVNLSATPAQCQVAVFRGNGRRSPPPRPSRSSRSRACTSPRPSASSDRTTCRPPGHRSPAIRISTPTQWSPTSRPAKPSSTARRPAARTAWPVRAASRRRPSARQNAFCYGKSGTFFVPTVKDDYRRENFSVPAGTYSSLHFSVEVVNGGWAQPTSGLNLMFWLARDGRHFNLFGFAGFKGPSRNTVLFRHGIGMVAGDKPKFESGFKSEIGQTYIFDYTYNPAEGFLDLKILDKSGKVLWRATDKPNVKSIVIPEGEVITADFSNRLGANPAEPPSYGWQYRNLQFEIFK